MRFVFGDCELDTERYELRRAGHVVALEPKAFRVLVHLLRHHGRAVAKRDLLQSSGPAPRMSTTRNTPCAIVCIRFASGRCRDAAGGHRDCTDLRVPVCGGGHLPPTDLIAAGAAPQGRADDHTLSSLLHHVDWGEAPDVEIFYGRQTESTQLKQWLIADRCRLVAVLGMGGIGKTVGVEGIPPSPGSLSLPDMALAAMRHPWKRYWLNGFCFSQTNRPLPCRPVSMNKCRC